MEVVQLLEVRELTRKYGATVAVDRASFTVRPGEIVGFLGPNGAGKTTTIKVCAGLLKPTRGTVTVAGVDITERPLEAKRVIGYMPENPFLYEKLTARELLNFIAVIYRGDDAKARLGSVQSMLELVDLEDRADDLVESYSRGMRQKVALAAAFLHDPGLLLLDEPLGGLDAVAARRAKDLITSKARQGAAVLMSTHILEVAKKLCDRIVIIHRGRVVASGTLEDLRLIRLERRPWKRSSSSSW